jgi:hypothetical protein
MLSLSPKLTRDEMDPAKPSSSDTALTTSSAPEIPPASGPSVSQGFHPPLPPGAVRRSLYISAIASTIGAAFFSVIQGTVFSFFLEDLGMRERIPFFMALWSLASIGTLLVSCK